MVTQEEASASFPLVDTPDEEVRTSYYGKYFVLNFRVQLDEEGIKEKRKQKLLKAGYDARERARKEKEREREAKEAEGKREEEERERDLEGWANKLRQEHEVRCCCLSIDRQ